MSAVTCFTCKWYVLPSSSFSRSFTCHISCEVCEEPAIAATLGSAAGCLQLPCLQLPCWCCQIPDDRLSKTVHGTIHGYVLIVPLLALMEQLTRSISDLLLNDHNEGASG